MARNGALALTCLLLATTGFLLFGTASGATEGDLQVTGENALRTLQSDEMGDVITDAEGTGRQPLGYNKHVKGYGDDDDHSDSYSSDNDDDGKYKKWYYWPSHQKGYYVKQYRHHKPKTHHGNKYHDTKHSHVTGRKLMSYEKPHYHDDDHSDSYSSDGDDYWKYNNGYHKSYPKKAHQKPHPKYYKKTSHHPGYGSSSHHDGSYVKHDKHYKPYKPYKPYEPYKHGKHGKYGKYGKYGK